MVGAFWGDGSGVAHFAHLGGFATGFGIALLLCWKGWITMTWYEKSLVQAWQQRRAEKTAAAAPAEEIQPKAAFEPLPVGPSKPVPMLDLGLPPKPPPVDPAIHATCSCGRKIRAPRQYAGKTVLCPSCRASVLIPRAKTPDSQKQREKPADDGMIRFPCPCGKTIKVPARYAGRSGTCPRCGQRVRVPGTPHNAAGEVA